MSEPLTRVEEAAVSTRVSSATYTLAIALASSVAYGFLDEAMRGRLLFGLVCLMLVIQAQTLLLGQTSDG